MWWNPNSWPILLVIENSWHTVKCIYLFTRSLISYLAGDPMVVFPESFKVTSVGILSLSLVVLFCQSIGLPHYISEYIESVNDEFCFSLKGTQSALLAFNQILMFSIGCPFSKGYILRSCCMCTTVFKVHLLCICKTLSICIHPVMLDLCPWEILPVLQSHLPRKCTGIGAFLFLALNYGTPYQCTFVKHLMLVCLRSCWKLICPPRFKFILMAFLTLFCVL